MNKVERQCERASQLPQILPLGRTGGIPPIYWAGPPGLPASPQTLLLQPLILTLAACNAGEKDKLGIYAEEPFCF